MKENDKNMNEKYINWNGLHYAILYDTRSNLISSKIALLDMVWIFVLGSMFHRNRRMQPMKRNKEQIEVYVITLDSIHMLWHITFLHRCCT